MIGVKTENGAEYQARLWVEFQNGIDKRLRAILLDLNYYTETTFGISILITCLVRTIEENIRVGGSPTSAHPGGRGADLRSRIFTEKMLDLIKKYVILVWGDDMVYIVVHGKGANRHIHLNIKYKYRKDLLSGT